MGGTGSSVSPPLSFSPPTCDVMVFSVFIFGLAGWRGRLVGWPGGNVPYLVGWGGGLVWENGTWAGSYSSSLLCPLLLSLLLLPVLFFLYTFTIMRLLRIPLAYTQDKTLRLLHSFPYYKGFVAVLFAAVFLHVVWSWFGQAQKRGASFVTVVFGSWSGVCLVW